MVYKATEIEIAAGDTVTFLTAGGGGYGDPRERDAGRAGARYRRGRGVAGGRAKRYGARGRDKSLPA